MNTEEQDSHLRSAGLKVTHPRIKILELLSRLPQMHLSAEEVYRQLLAMGEEVSLATVYRVLTQFSNAGLVLRRNFGGDETLFELNEGEHHDHLVCVCCASVVEFMDPSIEQRQDIIAAEHQFSLTHHEMTLYGICKRCSQK